MRWSVVVEHKKDTESKESHQGETMMMMMMMMMMMSHHIQNRKRLCITSFKVVFLKKERKGKEREPAKRARRVLSRAPLLLLVLVFEGSRRRRASLEGRQRRDR